MARRFKRKLDTITSKKNSKQILEKVTKELIKEANTRLEKLDKGGFVSKPKKVKGKFVKREKTQFKSGTWSSKKLFEKLSDFVSDKRIKLPKNANVNQMIKIQKAIGQFLKSKTSTIKGISQVKKSTIKSLKETLQLDEDFKDISDKEAEDIYSLFEDNDFNDLASKVGSSELISLIEDAKEKNMSENKFTSTIMKHINSNDLDRQEKARNIYNKFVI